MVIADFQVEFLNGNHDETSSTFVSSIIRCWLQYDRLIMVIVDYYSVLLSSTIIDFWINTPISPIVDYHCGSCILSPNTIINKDFVRYDWYPHCFSYD